MMERFIHIYLWACPLHTANRIIVKEVELWEGEDFEPCSCATAFYLPILDLSIDRKRILRIYIDDLAMHEGFNIALGRV